MRTSIKLFVLLCLLAGWGIEHSPAQVVILPDIRNEALSFTQPVLLRGVTNPVTLRCTNRIVCAGGLSDLENQPVRVRLDLRTFGGALAHSELQTNLVSCPSLGTVTSQYSLALTIPAGTKLSNLIYSVATDWNDNRALEESSYTNNAITNSLWINHYSGRLLFNEIETWVTITNYDTRSFLSATDHWIDGHGTLNGVPFSFSRLAANRNLETLDYAVASSDTNVIPVAATNWNTVAGVRFRCPQGVTLNKDGMAGAVRMRMPLGLGYSFSKNDHMLRSAYEFSSRPLKQDFYPVEGDAAGGFYFCEESKPVWIETSGFTWDPEAGRVEFIAHGVSYVRTNELRLLEQNAGQLSDPRMALKRSNEQYYRFARAINDPVVDAGASGDAQLTAAIEFSPGWFVSHFPYDVSNRWEAADSFVMLIADQPFGMMGGLADPQTMQVRGGRDCPDGPCAGSEGPETFLFDANDQVLRFTPDGGLRREVTMTGSSPLAWGALLAGGFAHEAGTYTDAGYHMPGHFLRGDAEGLQPSDRLRVAAILLSGVLPEDSPGMERPGTAAYLDGAADYAGLNFSVGGDVQQGRSTLGGADSGWYNLSARSKYYVRDSGVSGIHEAQPGTFPASLVIYGYTNTFSNFALSLLSGEPQASRTEGTLLVPYPCAIEQPFEEMMFSCLGDLTSAKIPSGGQPKRLSYWTADVLPLAIRFADGTTDCATPKRYLTMGVQTRITHVEQPLFGVLGFHPNGNLIPASLGLDGVDSRLSLPNALSFQGPQSERYYFNPIAGAYYNHYADITDPQNNPGFINLVGHLDVAFFSDIKAHLQMTAASNNPAARIHVMGGWPNHGWTNSAGEHFFTSAAFDAGNSGFPVAADSLVTYRAGDKYRPRALKSWAGVINLEYPLFWSHATRSFKSPAPLQDDFLVVQVEHQVDYLSAQNAELSFGVQYDGVPCINLANMAFNAIDESTGVMSAMIDAVGSNVYQSVLIGQGELNAMLADSLEDLFDPMLDTLLDPVIDEMYDALQSAHAAPGASAGYYTNVVARYVQGQSGAPATNIHMRLGQIVSSASGTNNLLTRIDKALRSAETFIDAFTTNVMVDPSTGEPLEPPFDKGLIYLVDGSHPVLQLLSEGLLRWLSPTLADGFAMMRAHMAKLRPAVNAIATTMGQIRGVVSEARERLGPGRDFREELDDAVPPGIIAGITSNAADRINAFLLARLPDPSVAFDSYTREELQTMIKQAVRDEFLCSEAVPEVQYILRERVYDLNASLREASDTVFQQVNLALRRVASALLSELDDSINGMLGDISDLVGAGQINGYAHINGDSLKELRLDGKFNWEVPDEMEFNGYLIVRELNSQNTVGCGPAGGSATEVILGATDVGIEWISDGLSADIAVKFAFESDSGIQLIGLGGAFELTGGSINFEAFSIEELAAAVAFGKYENYLSAATRAKFSSYEVVGGVYFGRTCSHDPIALWDPDVAEVLGDPPFTGIYVYGQCWGPIYGGSCMFNISAGIGAGFFYFAEGPVGGKIYLGVGGEILCIVSIKGEVYLIGSKRGDDFTLLGKGRLSGRLGYCPLCVTFDKTVKVTYRNDAWSADF